MSMLIRTVLGDKRPEELGVILPHEHTIYSLQGAEVDHKSAYDREAALQLAADELKTVKDLYGVSGLLDAAPFDLGRDIEFDVEISKRSGVHIIASTGIFGVWGFPYYWQMRDIDAMEEFFHREITEGVVGTGVKCGVIKVGSGPGLIEMEPGTSEDGGGRIPISKDRAFRAAARVQRSLGVAITTHTDPSDWDSINIGSKQLDILEEEGADPSRCIIGHATGTANLGYLVDLLKRGCAIGFDTIGLNWGVSLDVIAGMVVGLVALGYEKQLLLSHDRWSTEVTRPPIEKDIFKFEGVDLGFLHREFIPKLMKMGISQDVVRQITVANPQRLLAF